MISNDEQFNDDPDAGFTPEQIASFEAAEECADRRLRGYIQGRSDRDHFYLPMIEQFCRDLNEAHNEILRAQGVSESDFDKYDWPEWTPQANSIRWAEQQTKKKLAKTDHWTLYPSTLNETKPDGKSGVI